MEKKKEEKKGKSSLQQQFTDALPMFLPLVAGGLLGGLETGVAAQEGANQALQQQMKAEQDAKAQELAAREVAVKEARESREERLAKQDIALRERQVALAERQATGRGAGEQLTAAKAAELGQFESAEGLLDEMKSKFDQLGPGAVLTQYIPTTDAARFESSRVATAQTIGKILEGGKLTDVDFEKYLDLMPSQSDSKGTAQHKIGTIKKMIELEKTGQLESLRKAGFNVNEFIREEKAKIDYRKRVEDAAKRRGLLK